MIMTMNLTIAAILAGLIAANFAYQVMGAHDYMAASERSFFQAVAVLAVWCAFAVRQAN